MELLVWAPVASVAEGGEHHVEAESNIQLYCQLRPEANHHNSSSISSSNDTAGREQPTALRHLTLPTVYANPSIRPFTPELSTIQKIFWFLCQVVGGGAPFVWFHNGRPLIHGGKSSGGLGLVSIYLEESENNKDGSDWTAWTSRLVIQRADPADSGNYTCVPWRGKAASVSVFVSQGESKDFLLLHLQSHYHIRNRLEWCGLFENLFIFLHYISYAPQ